MCQVLLDAGGTELKYVVQVAGRQDVRKLERHSTANREFPVCTVPSWR